RISFPFLLLTVGLAVGPTLLPVETIVVEGPAVGMEPLPVGTLVSPARTFVASKEVKTLAISSESVLILSAAASPSLEDLLPLIGASSPDLTPITASLSSKYLTLSFNLLISTSCA
nr:hypothetical protein [Tanacetum cinerariifolium]